MNGKLAEMGQNKGHIGNLPLLFHRSKSLGVRHESTTNSKIKALTLYTKERKVAGAGKFEFSNTCIGVYKHHSVLYRLLRH